MNLIEKPQWGHTQLNTPIPLFHSEQGYKNGLLLIGGVHGDEPEGVELAMRSLDWLRHTDTAVETPWAVIPCLNPDGVTLRQRMNANDVDLNRNYPSSDWSAEARKARYYPGRSPGSEPEIQHLLKLIADMQPRLIIHCHSWKPCIVYAGEPAAKTAKILGQASGYKCLPDIGYPTPGSLSSYAWNDQQIPVICIEEESLIDRKTIWHRFAPAIKTIFTEFNALMSEDKASQTDKEMSCDL